MAFVTVAELSFKGTVGQAYWQQLSDNAGMVSGLGGFMNAVSSEPAAINDDGSFGHLGDASFDIGGTTFAHSAPYLYYRNREFGAGGEDNVAQVTVFPVYTEVGEPVSLPQYWTTGNIEGGYVDLESQVPWLVPGVYYTVRGVLYAFEVENLS